ncbi:MAG: hypothetical protein IJ628_08170 [Bacteroidaceae bacterium]|nr:hypothetical protein [Bacteroidaceae bacterium]
MNYVEKIMKLEELTDRIKKGRTGTQIQLAKEMHTSKTSLNRWFSELKDMGAEIEFDRIMNTYYINNEFTIHVEVTVNDRRQ